jgi:hypothetical protein
MNAQLQALEAMRNGDVESLRYAVLYAEAETEVSRIRYRDQTIFVMLGMLILSLGLLVFVLSRAKIIPIDFFASYEVISYLSVFIGAAGIVQTIAAFFRIHLDRRRGEDCLDLLRLQRRLIENSKNDSEAKHIPNAT